MLSLLGLAMAMDILVGQDMVVSSSILFNVTIMAEEEVAVSTMGEAFMEVVVGVEAVAEVAMDKNLVESKSIPKNTI